MADLTPHDLLDHIVTVCSESSIVTAYTVRALDLDILSLRVHLVDDSFIEVFYNAMTDKTALALVVKGERIYGKDNAKIGWHVHPFANPEAHVACNPVSFEEFLGEVETHRFAS